MAEDFTPIARINGGTSVNIRGSITYRSDVEPYGNDIDSGQKICLDINDGTGEIRVFGWHQLAEDAGLLFSRGEFLEIKKLNVEPRKPQYNNLPHPYQLKLTSKTEVNVREDVPMPYYEDEVACDSYAEVKSAKHPKFTYFTVEGKIVDIGAVHDGTGPRGNKWKRQLITIQDEEGNSLKIAVWNEYIPVSKGMVGQILKVIRGKYNDEYDSIDSTGARIEMDGERII